MITGKFHREGVIAMAGKRYTMLQACRETGMTYEALKYYCNEGLVPEVTRDGANRRVFEEYHIKWIKDLTCLKKCGLSIKEMKAYLSLCLEGPSTIKKRKEMLAEKKKALQKEKKIIEDSLAYIDQKQDFYQSVLDGKIEYQSNLVARYRI